MVKDSLAPAEAETVASEVRSQHGLGQKYRITVQPSRHGWHVRDQKGHIDSVPPMPMERWKEYLEARFVEAIAEREETSEA
jgi:hypothetical protein